jgi:hypothetical protein
MQDWIKAVASALAAAAVACLTGTIKHLWNRQKSVQDGMLALMHDRIFTIYGECSRKGYASVEDIRNLEYLYRPYHALGGNGTGTELFERVKKMPTEPPQSATA